MTQSIVLIGFMGAGKSSVGKRLAERLSLPFVDTDEIIERKTGRTISAIFAEQGESAFRDLETATLRELLQSPPAVFATGGGIVTREENWPLLKALGWVVHLHAPAEALFQRVSRQGHRPLLRSDNPRETFDALYKMREALYRPADLIIDSADSTPNQVADAILRKWREARPL
jgi:shikimate kinase